MQYHPVIVFFAERSSSDLIFNIIISFLSTLLALILSLWVERKRQPFLEITADNEANVDNTYSTRQPGDQRWKFFRVRVKNKAFPGPLGGIPRYTAQACSAKVTFRKIGSQEFVIMDGRWASTPELAYLSQDQRFVKALFPDSISITQNSSEILDVIVKPAAGQEAYGWNNEAYLNDWRNPRLRLDPGEYEVKVEIKTQNGFSFLKSFRLIVDGTIEGTSLHAMG